MACINEFIESTKDGYNNFIGERGIKLSGGKRQRLGIARALYKNPSVLVLDEATSSLDDDTEKSVIKAIEKLNSEITIIMVVHRISTLKNCDKIYNLKQGGDINYFSSFNEFYKNKYKD
mgnify:FL=1